MTNTSRFYGLSMPIPESCMVSDETISDEKLSDMACMVNIISVGSTNSLPLSSQAGIKNSVDI